MTIKEKLTKTGPKRLLALDGGGVRSAISLEILAELERTIRQTEGAPETFVLADYYDYIAGTGSGAFIAACLSLGMHVADICTQFTPIAIEAFAPTDSVYPVRSRQREEKLDKMLQELFGLDTLLGSDKLKTLLLLVLKAADSDSPWTLTNNPNAFYNQANQPKNNLTIPLWQLVKASLTTPIFICPEQIQLPTATLSMVDGSVSMYNNPAFLLFLNVTSPIYKINWPVGEDKLQLTSVGTGRNPGVNVNIGPKEVNPLFQMGAISSGLLQSASFEQDYLCRFFGRCVAGDVLTQEIGDMIGQKSGLPGKFFTYLRYDIELSNPNLFTIGLASIPAESVLAVDAVDALPALQLIGKTVAQNKVMAAHFTTRQTTNLGSKEVPSRLEMRGPVAEKRGVDFSFLGEPAKETPQQKDTLDEEKIQLAQGYEYQGNSSYDSWKWWIWVKGTEKTLDTVAYVTYYLHSSFPNPVRKVTDRKSKFRLDAVGWGVFLIRATITFKNGKEKQVTHYLELGYPDGTFTTK
ncbi:patatin [Spirosoma sp. HMF4905]|uniref:Patatin n=1 Tax=Spirosoma arboris TaxID=2682092 RepID=A0A7K1SK10_9BACT|nr:pYEATS domain-containing protein [Spirosoma arboris]MVM34149.1 patatin [Spirosoma arboris]